MSDILTRLSAVFPPKQVRWRVEADTNVDRGTPTAYVDIRDIMDRLDEVCGTRWQCRYGAVDDKVYCEVGLLLDLEENYGAEWVIRAGVAEGTEEAFRRAAECFGIGRYLRGLNAPCVKVEQGRIKPSELIHLRQFLEPPESLVDLLRRSIEIEGQRQ